MRVRAGRVRRLFFSLPSAADRGEVSLSHLGVIALIALVSGALVATGLPTQISGRVGTAVCQVTAEDCEPVHTADQNTGATDGTNGPGEPGEQGGPQPPTTPRTVSETTDNEPDDGSDDDGGYWSCGWAGQEACDMVQGFGRGTGDVITGVAESACLAHLCSHSGFKNAWKGTFDGVEALVTDPVDSLKSMWDDSTKDIRNDWKNDHKASAITRVVPTVLGSVFGGKSLGMLRKLGKTSKAEKAAAAAAKAGKRADEAVRKADDARRRAEEAAAKGDIKTAETALKEAERHTRAAVKAAEKSSVHQHKIDAAVARERIPALKKTVMIAKIQAIMAKSSIGRRAQKIIENYSVKVMYENFDGTYYIGPDSPGSLKNVIHLDTAATPEKFAPLALIHEAHHAESVHTGRSLHGREREMSRDDYIDGMLKEEAEGKVLEIEAARELRAQGERIPVDGFDPIYQKAYDRAVKAAAKKNKDLTEQERSSIGKQAGTEALVKRIRERPPATQGSGQSHVDEYGARWDWENRPGS